MGVVRVVRVVRRDMLGCRERGMGDGGAGDGDRDYLGLVLAEGIGDWFGD